MLVLTSSWVYHPNKPGKICVVFDLSAEFHETSVNEALLTGSDLTNQIVGVFLQFREEQIAVRGHPLNMYATFSEKLTFLTT